MKLFLYHCHLFLSRFFAWLNRVEHLYKARYAHFHELARHYVAIWNIFTEKAYVMLAEGLHNQLICVKPSKNQKELGNIFILGVTRRGKGLNITTNLLRWPFPVVTNDIKQEFWDKTAGWRGSEKGLDGRSLKFDPRGYGCKFDPLEGRETESDLQSAATILLFRPNEGENQIFTDTAITMLTQIFLAARLEGERPLPFTYKIINEGLYGAATILEIISEKHNCYPNLATVFLDISYEKANFTSQFINDCWSTLTRRMRRILTKESVRCFTGSDFTPKDIIISGVHPISLYLCWPERDLLALSPLIELMWDSLFNGMVDAYDSLKGVGCVRTLAVLDEIFRTGMKELPSYVTTVCGRNISILLSAQNTSQLDAAYGTYNANVLRSQFDSIVIHPPAPGDYETMLYIQQLLGDTSGFAHSKNERGEVTGTGESEQRIPLIPSYETELLDLTEVIVKRRGTRATIAKRLDWHRFPELVAQSNMEPPKLTPLPAVYHGANPSAEDTNRSYHIINSGNRLLSLRQRRLLSRN
jgi:type IV secretion system protein VirD4